MDVYLELAKICHERGLAKDFQPEILQQALVYVNTDTHQPALTPGLTWCGFIRDASEEERDSCRWKFDR